MKSNKLELRLWPYIQYPNHREYIARDDMLYFEGLYFDYMKHRWMPQDARYGLKTMDVQVEFLNSIDEIDKVTQDFNREAYSRYYAERTLQKKLAGTVK